MEAGGGRREESGWRKSETGRPCREIRNLIYSTIARQKTIELISAPTWCTHVVHVRGTELLIEVVTIVGWYS